MTTLLPRNSSHHRTTDGELTAGLRTALNLKYGRVFDVARREWERNFAQADPSNACVSVRISEPRSVRRVLSGSHYFGY
jgi:hypothetical protein